jgi:uncharacterized DUF497 family protein
MELRFEWDARKDQANQAKHGVSFDEARTAFLDMGARVVADPEHSTDEDRFILLGLSINLRVLVVCHCYRETENTIRIFSARRANMSEQREYTRWLR